MSNNVTKTPAIPIILDFLGMSGWVASMKFPNPYIPACIIQLVATCVLLIGIWNHTTSVKTKIAITLVCLLISGYLIFTPSNIWEHETLSTQSDGARSKQKNISTEIDVPEEIKGKKIVQTSHGDYSPNVVGDGNTFNYDAPQTVRYHFNYTVTSKPIQIDPSGLGTYFSTHSTDVLYPIVAKMIELNENSKSQQLLDLADENIKKYPDWQTPYAFKGFALVKMGKESEGMKLIFDVAEKTKDDPSFSQIHDIAKRLREMRIN